MERGEEPPGAAEWERDEAIVGWIYGSIITGAAVAISSGSLAKTDSRVFLYVTATMVVVWLAHVYAAFVGHGGRMDVAGTRMRLGNAFGADLAFLGSAVPTLVALAVCWALGLSVSTTGYVGLTATVTTMVGAATYAARNAGAGFAGAALAAIGALVIGAALIIAKVALK